jgi:hypothetical protein
MYNNFNGDWKNPKSGKSGDTIPGKTGLTLSTPLKTGTLTTRRNVTLY